MAITVTFDPPLPSDSPSVFNTKAFQLLGDLNDWSGEANTLASEVNADEAALAAAVSSASGSASIATTKAADASGYATTATTQAGIATTKAGEANASAIAAAAAAASVNLGSVDINGGTIDGTVIGGSAPAAGSFTTLTVPTVALGDSSTNAATTAFVASSLAAEINQSAAWYHTNAQKVSSSITLPSTHNAWAAGPIRISDGVTVTVSDNATLSIV